MPAPLHNLAGRSAVLPAYALWDARLCLDWAYLLSGKIMWMASTRRENRQLHTAEIPLAAGASEGPGGLGPAIRLVRLLAAATLLGSFVYVVLHTRHWPLIADAQVMRYVNFLIDHGFAPYRDIIDINMPGSYFSDRVAVALFGTTDLGWRMYDVFLMVVGIAAMVIIALPYDWLAGLFAGVVFSLLHAADGPTGIGERDQVITVLMLLGVAALFHAVRRKQPGWTLILGLTLGMAATIKPTTVALGPALLVLLTFVLHRRGVRAWPYLVFGVLGASIASGIFFGFLFRHGSTKAFFEITRTITPYYAGLQRTSIVTLLREIVPRELRPLIVIGVAAAVAGRRHLGWERLALAVCLVIGLFCYFVQGKGFFHHRYELMAFSLLWFAIELALATRRPWGKLLAGLAVATTFLFTLPRCLSAVRSATFENLYRFVTEADTDLRRLGPDRLQGKVQCLDMTDGCMDALYRLQLVQNTGVTGDTLYFSSDNASPLVQHYRELFLQGLHTNPPDVFLMSNELFLDSPTFDKLKRWPTFARYLGENYDLYSEHVIDDKFAFRIYVRKGSPADNRHF